MSTLKINEIFLSIQGESSFAGLPCVFIRTTGCPLRCRWCDTTYAYSEGRQMAVDEIVEQVLEYAVPLVQVTGGEPLAQPGTLDLLARLCDADRTVLLETSGAQEIVAVDPRVHVIMDLKCPGSEMSERMHRGNLGHLKSTDQVKFVLASREDYEFARQTISDHDLAARSEVLLSVAAGQLDHAVVVRWMLQDRLAARFQLQLHKIIWEPGTRGV